MRSGGKQSKGLTKIVGEDRWGEAEARVVVSAWRRSGKSMAAFAREHGLVAQRLSRWSRRVKGAATSKVRFHPVRLIEGRREVEGFSLEVVLVDGRRVRVQEGFSAEELERALMVLEGGA